MSLGIIVNFVIVLYFCTIEYTIECRIDSIMLQDCPIVHLSPFLKNNSPPEQKKQPQSWFKSRIILQILLDGTYNITVLFLFCAGFIQSYELAESKASQARLKAIEGFSLSSIHS